jgi:lactate 2-monooxygenase
MGSVGSAAVATALTSGPLAAARPAPAQAGAAGTPAPPSTYYTYQSEIYLNGMVMGAPPPFTTNLSQLEARASKALDRQARGHLLTSAGGGPVARANARAFRRWRIIPRMFRAHAKRDVSTTLLGVRMPAPIILAPVGRQRLAHRDGELASARAAAELDLTYVQSARASFSLERVARANGDGSRWYQFDWPRGDGGVATRLRRARSAGYTHLLLTPPAPGQSWEQLPLIRRSWDGPILLTGIRTVRGAKRAATRGFDGIVVSNHRGRRGGAAAGSVDALAPIVDAVGARLAVLFESGVRTGTEAFKALALGADAVMVGRPYVYGLALDGQAGVTHVLRTLLAEFDLTLANAGYRTHRELKPASLTRVD